MRETDIASGTIVCGNTATSLSYSYTSLTLILHSSYILLSPTVPSGSPASVVSGVITPNSITLHWSPVECIHRNGDITGYSIRVLRNGAMERFVEVQGDTREATVYGLTPSTQYTVQVAAVNSAGTGPYSRDSIAVETEGIFFYNMRQSERL